MKAAVPPPDDGADERAEMIHITGRVQGVGFRAGAQHLALQYGVRALGTAERLRALVVVGRIDETLARDLTDAVHFLIGVKLASNLRQMAAARPPDNAIRLAELGTLERQALKDSLAIVRRFKQWLGRHYRLDAL